MEKEKRHGALMHSFYTRHMAIDLTHPLVQAAFTWAASKEQPALSKDDYCQTRDVLRTRVDWLRQYLLRKEFSVEQIPLLHALLAEIGNNAYDHNIGRWRDMPGVFFGKDLSDTSLVFVIADRGQGILMTLKQVLPDLASDMDALHVAFLERITGRAPEHRGNV